MSASELRIEPARGRDMAAMRHGAAQIGRWSVPGGQLDPPEVLDILAALYATLEVDPGWGGYLVINGDMIVGACSLTEPPSGARCSIGYSIFPAFQGCGHATLAVSLLLGRARDHGITTFDAETSPDNGASHAVLVKCGFRAVGRRVDPDDGDLVVWRLQL